MFSSAFAQTAAGGAASAGSEWLMQLVPLALVFLIFYFLVLRPQQARTREHQQRVRGAKRGDVVVTAGGLVGKVTRDNDEAEVEVEIAPNVRVRVVRQMISEVRGIKTAEPAKPAERAKKPEAVKSSDAAKASDGVKTSDTVKASDPAEAVKKIEPVKK